MSSVIPTLSHGQQRRNQWSQNSPQDINALLSIQLGPEPTLHSAASHAYTDIPCQPLSRPPRMNERDTTELKTSYRNDSSGLNSARGKYRPVPRPPPRSASESDVDTHFPHVPPRTYLNNEVSSATPMDRDVFLTDCINDVNSSQTTTTTKCNSTKHGTQRLYVIIAFVAIIIALALAATAAFFSIRAYQMAHDSKKVKMSDPEDGIEISLKASAHVGLWVDKTEVKISDTEYTLHLRKAKSTSDLHLHNVTMEERHLVINNMGLYFVYTSIGYNTNEINIECFPYTIWTHRVVLERRQESKQIKLLKIEHSCCLNCSEYHANGFNGGAFKLESGDRISARVSSPNIVFDNSQFSFLGLFLVR